MDITKVVAVLESPSEANIRTLLNDEATVFWIDWRHEDETIAEDCESILNTGQLSAELVDVDTDEGFELYVQFRERRVKVPLNYSADDRHITIHALNSVLGPDYEVRFCVDSNGGDTLAFLPLECKQWAEFESRFGDAVSKRFYKVTERPNLFTDQLPF